MSCQFLHNDIQTSSLNSVFGSGSQRERSQNYYRWWLGNKDKGNPCFTTPQKADRPRERFRHSLGWWCVLCSVLEEKGPTFVFWISRLVNPEGWTRSPWFLSTFRLCSDISLRDQPRWQFSKYGTNPIIWTALWLFSSYCKALKGLGGCCCCFPTCRRISYHWTQII